jgi:ribosomal protein S18 acetylase RimI-like enzyme
MSFYAGQRIFNKTPKNKSTMKIEFTTSPQKDDIDFLTKKIDEETKEYGPMPAFAFFFRNKNDQIIAGCNGFVVYGAIYIDQLWVHPEYRKKGIARELMDQVHNYSKELGCTMVTLTTLSFQGAQEFYNKLGYKVDFEREGYQNNSKCIFLSKKL